MAIYGVVSSKRLAGRSWTAIDTIGIVVKAEMNLEKSQRSLRRAEASTRRCEAELAAAKQAASSFIRSLDGGEFVAASTEEAAKLLERCSMGS